MDNKRPDERIGEIIERLNRKSTETGENSETVATEYEFGSDKSNFVFEYAENDETDKKDLSVVNDKNVAIDAEPVSIKSEAPSTDDYTVSGLADTHTPIYTTYVPRFTEVSETYRMADDPRPRYNPKSEIPVTHAERVEEAVAQDSEVDPTSEKYEEAVDAVIVSMDRREPEEDTETLNVYKFQSQDTEQKSAQADEEELVDIQKLFVRKTPETESVDIATEDADESENAEKSYTLPDPEGDDINVVDYSSDFSNGAYADDKSDSEDGVENSGKHSSEFVHQAQRDKIKDKFLDLLMSIKIRFVVALIFAVLLLAFETLTAAGIITNNSHMISSIPGAFAIFDFLFAICLYLLALPETVRTVKYICRGKLLPDISLTVGILIILAYTVTVVVEAPMEYALYGFVFAVFVLAAMGSTYYRLKSDFEAFKLVSKNKEKFVLEKTMTRMLPEENIALDGAVDEYKSRTARIFRATFVTDFFKRTSAVVLKPYHTAIILAITLGVGAVFGGVCYFTADGILSAMSALSLIFLLGCPAFSLVSHMMPYYEAQQSSLADDSAVIGEASYEEFSDVDVIAFDDTEIFGPDDVNLKRFMLYGDRDNMEKAMRQMCSLFAVVGGPLEYIFTSSLDTSVRYSPASNAVIETDGLVGNVGGQRIAAGTEEYMMRHGIAIPDAGAKSEAGIDTTKIMYAAENGEVYAKFYIRYSFSEEFTMLLPSLKNEGVVPLIYTRDPNVSNELLRTLTAGADCMRVVKKLTPFSADDKLYRRISAGVVTYGNKMDAINVILLSKKHKKFGIRVNSSELYAMGAGTALAVMLSLLGMFVVPSAVFGLWQLAWCAVLNVVGKSVFRDKK